MNGITLLEAMEKAREQADYSMRAAGTWSKDHPVQIELVRKFQKRMRQWRKFRAALVEKIDQD